MDDDFSNCNHSVALVSVAKTTLLRVRVRGKMLHLSLVRE